MASHKVAFSCIYSHHTHIFQSVYVYTYVALYKSMYVGYAVCMYNMQYVGIICNM